MIKIIPATTHDFESIKELHQEISDLHAEWAGWNFQKLSVSLNKEYFESRLEKENAYFLLAQIDWKIAGYIAFELRKSENIDILKDRKWIFIEDICVSSKFRNKWIGSTLLRYVEEYAKSYHIDSIELSVWTFNSEAIDFYKKRWFEEFSVKMHKNI